MVARSMAKGRPRTGGPRFRTVWPAYLVGGLGVESGPADAPSFDFHFQRPQTRPIKITGGGGISTDGVEREKDSDLQTRSPRKGVQADTQHQPGVGCHQESGQERRRLGSTWETCANDGGMGDVGGEGSREVIAETESGSLTSIILYLFLYTEGMAMLRKEIREDYFQDA